MAKRYSGALEIEVDAVRGADFYRAIVRQGDRVLWYGNVRAITSCGRMTGGSPAAYDAAARSALAHAEEYAPSVPSLAEDDEDGVYKVVRARRRSARGDRASRSFRRNHSRPHRDVSRRNADLIAWYQKYGETNMPRGFRAEKIQWLRHTNRSNALDAVRRMGYRG